MVEWVVMKTCDWKVIDCDDEILMVTQMMVRRGGVKKGRYGLRQQTAIVLQMVLVKVSNEGKDADSW